MQLVRATSRALRSIQKQPTRVERYFLHPDVNYAAKSQFFQTGSISPEPFGNARQPKDLTLTYVRQQYRVRHLHDLHLNIVSTAFYVKGFIVYVTRTLARHFNSHEEVLARMMVSQTRTVLDICWSTPLSNQWIRLPNRGDPCMG